MGWLWRGHGQEPGGRDRESSKWTVTHVHNPAVDITELLEAKEPRTVCGVIEAVGLYVDNQYAFWGVELRIMKNRGKRGQGGGIQSWHR